MRDLLLRMAPILRLTRVSKAFAAAANLWFVVLWTRGVPEEFAAAPVQLRESPLWLLLSGGFVAGVGLYAYGAALNDVLDRRRDRTLRPDRPLASGQVSAEWAVTAVAVTLIAAVLGSTVFGVSGVVLTLVLGLAILVFNVAGKFVPGVGLLLLSVVYAGHMLVANPWLRFLWPTVLVMSHAILVAVLAHALERKSPPISGRAGVLLLVGWGVVLGVLVWAGHARSVLEGESWGASVYPLWLDPWGGAVWPILLSLVFVLLVARRIRKVGPGARVAEKINRYGAVWLPLYGVAWLLGEGLFVEAGILGALALVALLGLTVLREAYSLAEQPIGYRR